MLHQRNRRLYGYDACKTGILFALVAGIGDRIVGQQSDLLGNDLHFMAEELLANGLHIPAALAANPLLLRDFQKHLFLRQMIQHLSLGAFLFPLMSCNKNGIRFGFLRFVVLCGFRFVKQTELVFPKNVSFLLAGLTEPGSLGVGKDLVHVLQLALQFCDFRLLLPDGFFQNGHFRSGICGFLLQIGHDISS